MNLQQLDDILVRFPRVKVCVVGDLFLDKYLDIDKSLGEISLETGLEAHQVTQVRCYPGAGGTVANNLAALGVGRVAMLTLIGDDGEGYEVRRALRCSGIDDSLLQVVPGLFTPTYTKPLLYAKGRRPVELNRFDIKNRSPLPRSIETSIIDHLEAAVDAFDAVVVADQVRERNCGVITDRVCARLTDLGGARPDVVFLADSRCRIGEFCNVIVKPNRSEAMAALGIDPEVATPDGIAQGALALSQRVARPVYITLGEEGLLLASDGRTLHIPGYRVTGDTDVVGAGDSVTAGIVASLCSGSTLRQAGLIGNLVASIAVQQIGATGTASCEDVRRRFAEYCQQHPAEEEKPDEFRGILLGAGF